MFDVEGGALDWGAMCVRCALVPGRVAGAAPAGEGARGMGRMHIRARSSYGESCAMRMVHARLRVREPASAQYAFLRTRQRWPL